MPSRNAPPVEGGAGAVEQSETPPLARSRSPPPLHKRLGGGSNGDEDNMVAAQVQQPLGELSGPASPRAFEWLQWQGGDIAPPN